MASSGPFPTITADHLITKPQKPANKPDNVNRALSLFALYSESNIARSSSGLIRVYSDSELMEASQILQTLVQEAGASIGSLPNIDQQRSFHFADQQSKERIYRLVYGTMKYLPFIDTILLKTQFLVYHSQVMLYQAMGNKFEFDATKEMVNAPSYTTTSSSSPSLQLQKQQHPQTITLVRDLYEAFANYKVKLAAAFARIRIERKAEGKDAIEQMENILPAETRKQETFARDMIKYARINSLKTNPAQLMELLVKEYPQYLPPKPTKKDYSGSEENILSYIQTDPDFDSLLMMPPVIFEGLKDGELFSSGKLVAQDKVWSYLAKHLESIYHNEDYIIDARAGCGTGISNYAANMGNKGKIYAFEDRASILPILQKRIETHGVRNVQVIPSSFLNSDPWDEKFQNVTIIICDPPNSGTAVLDKLGYLLQEEELPHEPRNKQDLKNLYSAQYLYLKHAAEFPNVKHILYVTRSVDERENDHIISQLVNEEPFELSYVLPEFAPDRHDLAEKDEYFTVHPSEQGNGIFLAYLKKIMDASASEASLSDEIEVDILGVQVSGSTDGKEKQKKTLKKKKSKSKKKKFPSSKSINALSQQAGHKGMPHTFSTSNIGEHVEEDNTTRKSTTLTKSAHFSKNEIRTSSTYLQASLPRHYASTHLSQTQASHEGLPLELISTLAKKSEPTLGDFLKFGISGTGLKRFYAPRLDAIRKTRKTHWIYPVPNPAPWK